MRVHVVTGNSASETFKSGSSLRRVVAEAFDVFHTAAAATGNHNLMFLTPSLPAIHASRPSTRSPPPMFPM